MIKELQFARVLAKYMEQAKGKLEVELAEKDQLLRLAEHRQDGLQHTLFSQVSLLSCQSSGVPSLPHSSTPACFAYCLIFLALLLSLLLPLSVHVVFAGNFNRRHACTFKQCLHVCQDAVADELPME